MYKTVLLLTVTIVSLSGCGKESAEVSEPKSRPAKLFTVLLGESKLEQQFPAMTEAGGKATLAFRIPGQLQALNVDSGQQVKEGDVLASLNPDEYHLLYEQAKANFELATVQFDRIEKLHERRVVSEQDYDQALAHHQTALTYLEQAKTNLFYTNIVAPYEGTISLVVAENHEFISAKEAVMNIQTDQILNITFLLPNHLLNTFSSAKENTMTMEFDSFLGYSFPLKFKEIDTEADLKTGAYKVTMTMDNPSGVSLLPGMSGTVISVIDKGIATPLPSSSIFRIDSASYVWRVNEGATERVEVELNEMNHVMSGLEHGDQILESGVDQVDSDTKVREWIKERGL